jgi:hypothetical protein
MLKSKHLWHTVLSVLLCGCFLLLPSCSSDEPDSGDNQTDVPEDNLSDAARNFVGFWEVTENGKTSFSDLELFADGYCSDGSVGYWAFDETSNILSITLDSGTQWQITLSNGDSWVGLNLNNNRTCTAKRHSLLSDFDNHVSGEWLSDSTEMSLKPSWTSCNYVKFVKAPFELNNWNNKSGKYYMKFSNVVETDNGVIGDYCVSFEGMSGSFLERM